MMGLSSYGTEHGDEPSGVFKCCKFLVHFERLFSTACAAWRYRLKAPLVTPKAHSVMT
jgi:hypothetical protein